MLESATAFPVGRTGARNGARARTHAARTGGVAAVVALCAAICVPLLAGGGHRAVAKPTAAPATFPRTHGLTLAQAPQALRSAVERSTATAGPVVAPLRAAYQSASVALNGAGWSGSVGLGQVGRAGAMAAVSGQLDRSGLGAHYGSTGLEESFTATATGVEQSFTIARRPAGAGPLVIDVPLSGLSASGSGAALALHSSAGRTVGSYSGLRVTDASGRVVPATMGASAGGHSISIAITDSGARYPLHVDPVYVETSELTDPGTTACDTFGWSVAISGDYAVVGSPQQDEFDSCGTSGPGVAYVYEFSGGHWGRVATLPDPHDASGDMFGSSVAISGSTIVVGDWTQTVGGTSDEGAAYEYTIHADGTIAAAVNLTASGLGLNSDFGTSVATSGSTIAVGAPFANGANGATYVFTLSGTTWTQTGVLTPSDAGPADESGFSVAISESGTTIVAGALADNTGDVTAYVYTYSGSSWTQVALLSPGTSGLDLPATVAISGSTIVLGNQYGGSGGEAYVYPNSGSGWSSSPAATLDPPGADFAGRSVAISGNTIVVGAYGTSSSQGAAYVYVLSRSNWSLQGPPLVAGDGSPGDDLGWAVGVSGTTVIAGAYGIAGEEGGQQGAAYFFTPDTLQSGLLFTVNTNQDTDDGGCYTSYCTLRDAINAANAYAAADPGPYSGSNPNPAVVVNIPGAGAHTISVTSPLPAITGEVTLDATVQSGFTNTPLITLDGTNCTAPCDGLDINGAQGVLVRGLIIDNFPDDGIALSGGNTNLIAGDWIGWSAPGVPAGNGTAGIEITNSSDNTIGGTTAADRVVDGSNHTDVDITGAGSTANTVEGNWIAVAPDGVTAPDFGEGDGIGIQVENGASDNTIGG